MHVKTYKHGKILIPAEIRRKYNFEDNSDLIITECEDGVKISTKELILAKLRKDFAQKNLQQELKTLRNQEFDRIESHG